MLNISLSDRIVLPCLNRRVFAFFITTERMNSSYSSSCYLFVPRSALVSTRLTRWLESWGVVRSIITYTLAPEKEKMSPTSFGLLAGEKPSWACGVTHSRCSHTGRGQGCHRHPLNKGLAKSLHEAVVYHTMGIYPSYRSYKDTICAFLDVLLCIFHTGHSIIEET